MLNPVELVSDFIVQPILEWLFDLLPKPVRIGCLTIGGLGIVGLILWLWLK